MIFKYLKLKKIDSTNNEATSLKTITKINCSLIKDCMKKFVKNVKVKLPNDILIKKKKICGILQETITLKDRKFIIIGIGVNVKSSPKNLTYATSYIDKHTRKKISKTLVCKTIKKYFEKRCDYVLSR